jgi:hypothetical protein
VFDEKSGGSSASRTTQIVAYNMNKRK